MESLAVSVVEFPGKPPNLKFAGPRISLISYTLVFVCASW